MVDEPSASVLYGVLLAACGQSSVAEWSMSLFVTCLVSFRTLLGVRPPSGPLQHALSPWEGFLDVSARVRRFGVHDDAALLLVPCSVLA